ncbi:T9SS type A sorting domain-containing protein, partial [Bacteroidota bacterium]
VGYDVLNNSLLTTAEYEVEFFTKTGVVDYSMFWKMSNITTGELLVDSSEIYTLGETSVSQVVTEGFITRVEDITATIGQFDYQPESSVWYDPIDPELDTVFSTGVYYVGTDIPQGRNIPTFGINVPANRCDYISADRLRRVELRFGAPDAGKAYRYINNFIKFPQIANNYTYALAITGSDTVVAGSNYPIGNWDAANDRPFGFVDVPFTAWVVDDRYDEEYQLAVGFIEKRGPTNLNPQGNPDGIWDPSDSLKGSGEAIVIFDSPYDPEGGQIEYTGGDFETPTGTETVYSVLIKPTGFNEIPEDAIGITEEQRAIFNSSWFNAMYVVGLQRQNENTFFTEGDVYTVNLDVYPYTDADVYQFSINGNTIDENDERELWERVNVYPNPLYGFNTLTSHNTNTPDEPFVTFINLPEEVTIKIYSLSGTLLRTLTTNDKSTSTSPFLRWDLTNESGLRMASGMYLAIVSSGSYEDKILKFALIMPQKQIQRF